MLKVIDTNVLVVANGRSQQASAECQLAAVDVLVAVQGAGSLLLDAAGEITAEYTKHCSHAGQPGVGDEFFRWAFENQHSLTTILLTPHPDRRFEEFPDDGDLCDFDWDDRVFVCVSLACTLANQIVNAVDSDYSHAQAALDRVGVQVREICPSVLGPDV